MGLGGRSPKRRITVDPRNLSWAQDAERFGRTYLSRLGWDPSKGLGADGEGRTSHISISQKVDLLGIGAAQAKDLDGTAPTLNKDFESLLRRLNEEVESCTAGASKPQALTLEVGVVDNSEGHRDHLKSKKRKVVEGSDSDDGRRKARKNKKTSHKCVEVSMGIMERESCQSKSEASWTRSPTSRVTWAQPSDVDQAPEVASACLQLSSRPMAHRTRLRRSKNIALKSATAISEILGIPSSAPSELTSPSPAFSRVALAISEDSATSQELTTSTQSVADYFKERLRLKSRNSAPPASSLSIQEQDDF